MMLALFNLIAQYPSEGGRPVDWPKFFGGLLLIAIILMLGRWVASLIAGPQEKVSLFPIVVLVVIVIIALAAIDIACGGCITGVPTNPDSQ